LELGDGDEGAEGVTDLAEVLQVVRDLSPVLGGDSVVDEAAALGLGVLHGSIIPYSLLTLHSDVVGRPLSTRVQVNVLGSDVLADSLDQVVHPQVREVGHEVLTTIPVVGHGLL